MKHLKKIQNFRWYDAVSFTLNRVLAGDHANRLSDLVYGEATRQTLDLYRPHQPRADHPLIVFVHGGSWQRGQKDDYVFLAQSLAQAGIYVASVNYQYAPEAQFPVFVDDITVAVNWLQQTDISQQYGYNRDKVILMGHSAGAFNIMSAIYGTTQQQRIEHFDGVRGLIGFAGPYSFEHRGDPIAKFAFAQDVSPEVIMPSFHVYPNHLNHLLLMAEKDTLVKDENTYKMRQALQQVDNHVEIARIARTNHISIIATVAKGIEKFYPTKPQLLKFIDLTLQ